MNSNLMLPAHANFHDRISSLCERLVLSILSDCQTGQLRLCYADGREHVIGTEDGTVTVTLAVKHRDFFQRCVLFGDLGLAESYIDGLFECSSIRDLITWFLLNRQDSRVINESEKSSIATNVLGGINKLLHRFRHNSVGNSKRNIKSHYDLGNKFFELFLDASMLYSCGLFTDKSMSLEAAQLAKMQRMARQLRIDGGDKVLDLGCGWGSFSIFLAKYFGCDVTATTISDEQFDFLSHRLKRENLQSKIKLIKEDYRNLSGKYDKIGSIEMIEAVGDEYLDTFAAKLDNLLKPNGLLVMQMITCPDARYDTLKKNVDFIQKHIFPGSLLPSLNRLTQAFLGCGEIQCVDLFDMTSSYVETLSRWQVRFIENSSEVKRLGFDDAFIRKWVYYFEYCQAAFDTRNISVVQATYSRPNNKTLRSAP